MPKLSTFYICTCIYLQTILARKQEAAVEGLEELSSFLRHIFLFASAIWVIFKCSIKALETGNYFTVSIKLFILLKTYGKYFPHTHWNFFNIEYILKTLKKKFTTFITKVIVPQNWLKQNFKKYIFPSSSLWSILP